MPEQNPVAAALELHEGRPLTTRAGAIEAALRSAVRAVIPGRQKGKNLAPLMREARKAFARTLRRRARA